MKLEYLDDITDNGKYPWADPQQLIRLYDFDQTESQLLIDLINTQIIVNQEPIDLTTVPFIHSLNCQLKLEVSERDIGIYQIANKGEFICKLRVESYRKMIGFIQALINEDGSVSGYNWLYDPGADQIDLLFSEGGSW